MSVPILECVDVHAAYGRIEVLRGVDLSIPKGAVMALLGAVGPEQRHHRTPRHPQVDAAQHLDAPVRRVQVDDLQDRDAHARTPSSRISCVVSTAAGSAGVSSSA